VIGRGKITFSIVKAFTSSSSLISFSLAAWSWPQSSSEGRLDRWRMYDRRIEWLR